MQFYKIEIEIDMVDEDEDSAYSGSKRIRSRADRDFGYALSQKCEKYSEKITDKGYLFLRDTNRGECTFGMIIREYIDVKKYVEKFAKASKLDVESMEIREITLNEFGEMLHVANRNNYVYDNDDVLREFGLDDLVRNSMRSGFFFDEDIICERDKEAIYLSAKSYFTKKSLIPELDRIYFGSVKKVHGHPVDYMVESDDERTYKGTTRLLMQALFNRKRIENRRFCEIEIEPGMNFNYRKMEALFKSSSGGTIVFSMTRKDEEGDDLAHGEYFFIEDICSIIRRHCCDVLTIICLPRECKSLRNMIFEHMGNSTFVEIQEEVAVDNEAISYLKNRAKEHHIRPDKRLFDIVEKGRGYTVPELNGIFSEWYGRKLKTTVFSQYKDIEAVKTDVKNRKPKGSAYKELESMIGLSSAKKVINQALDSYKAKILFKDKGLCEDSMCNHMIFIGNPGTAKTTVARLFAKILKDNEVLSCGHIIEVGRGDLVGRYVGWTAPIIKKKFKDAMGGILFIDEAYSLVDDRNGSFGDEAINTIVQEMENHRDDVIVIFAGYPDKMEGFLDKNPGLRSRIAHYVHFEDYDVDELCQIAKHIAEKSGMIIDNGAMEKLRDVMEEAKNQDDFGNGRYVRNVIEKARMAQNSRLVRMDYDSVTSDDVKRICAEDIVAPETSSGKTAYHIGFSVT